MLKRLVPMFLVVMAFASFAQAGPPAGTTTVVEAEKGLGTTAAVFRDTRASGGQCAVAMLSLGGRTVSDLVKTKTAPLPAGDYLVTAWLEVVPLDAQHGLNIRMTAGDATRTITPGHLDPWAGYTPVTLRVLHLGGPLSLTIDAVTDSGFNGMRAGQSAEEKTFFGDMKPKTADLTDKKKLDSNADSIELEEARDINTLKPDEVHIACDRIEVKPLCLSNALVSVVDTEKIHYLPGEVVNGTCTLVAATAAAAGPYHLQARLVSEVDQSVIVYEQDVQLAFRQAQAVKFSFKLDPAQEFGRELRCVLLKDGKEVHSNAQVFGVSRNVYRIGISAQPGPQNVSHYTVAEAETVMQENKKQYANYFERFAWAPCDYSNLSPETEYFFSGQTQYPGSITGFKNLINTAHKYGIKVLTYGKNAAGGIEGSKTYMRHPDWFGGPAGEYDTFYLERSYYDEYKMDDGTGKIISWESWPNWWANEKVDAAVDFGCDAIIKSVKMFGWDGVRWDGHFPDRMDRFKARMEAQYPSFIEGYNISFANPGAAMFLPSLPVSDFMEIAKNHGLLMDESIREWSSGYNAATVRPYYNAICREADYEKRIGGLPLFITFDVGTRQDSFYNILWGLAAGQRYTYITTIGDFNYGPLTRFLTRYSAFVWDDTARIKDPASVIEVTVSHPPKPPNPKAYVPDRPAPWFDQSTWLRKLPNGNQQLLINLVNPPNFPVFASRVQTPPAILHDLSIKVRTPAGAKLARAFHVSIDNPEGLTPLVATADAGSAAVTLPELRQWSIVVFEYAPDAGGGSALAYPVFALTTPVEDAAKVLSDAEKQAAAAAEQAAKKEATGMAAKTGPAKDAVKVNPDLEPEKTTRKPATMVITRDGVLDVEHVKGMYSWFNPFDNAVGLLGGGNLRSSYATHFGFRLGAEGCLENFTDSYKQMFTQDAVILDNVSPSDIGIHRRIMIADYVRSGGGLIIVGGCYNLSMDNPANTYTAELAPVTVAKYADTLRDDKGMAFTPEKNDVFSSAIDWSQMQTFSVDLSVPLAGAQVLARVNGHPAIISATYGKGRIICFLTTTMGNVPEGPDARPYWLSSQWPLVLADAVRYVAGDYKSIVKPPVTKRTVDQNKSTAEDLLLNGDSMQPEEFTKKLTEASGNIDDATSATTLLEAANASSAKIMDRDLLLNIVDEVVPYIDDSFAPLAEEMIKKQDDYFRVAGFTLLRYCASPKYRLLLESALRETNPAIVRPALAALAHSKDPASIPAIKAYLGTKNPDKLLAFTALRAMGQNPEMEDQLKTYIVSFNRVTALTANRKAIYETLHGGTSFKLTLAARRKINFDYMYAQRDEKEAIFDVNQFRATFNKFTDAEADQFTQFIVNCPQRAAGSIGFAALPYFTAEQATRFRQAMANAKLPALRLLAPRL